MKKVSSVLKALIDLKTNRYMYRGPSRDGSSIPCGLSRVSCSGFIAIAFVDVVNQEIVSMFSLEPGRIHVVKCPDNVLSIVECEPDVEWLVSYSNRFNQSDPTRVETSLIRPRTPQEEMQDYINEVAARAAGRQQAEMLRTGRAEFDMENDDYDEYKEDDEIAPLTVYQMEGIISEIRKDIEHSQKVQKDIEEEAPPVDLKKGGNEPPIEPDPADPEK